MLDVDFEKRRDMNLTFPGLVPTDKDNCNWIVIDVYLDFEEL